MKKMILDNKGVLLVAAIILFYFSMVSLLMHIVPGVISAQRSPGKAAEFRTGTEAHGFTVTAYCPGSCCNGIWAGLTASGKSIEYYTKRNVNIAAVDPEIIPMGTLFAYGGREYLAVDIGSMIRGKRIDLLVVDHEATYEFGVRKNQSILILSTRPLASRPGAGLTDITYRQNAPQRSSVQ